jgi:hypothetical protein
MGLGSCITVDLAMARCHGSTERVCLENLVLAEDNKIVAKMALDSPEWSGYFQLHPMRTKAGRRHTQAARPRLAV